MGFLLPKDVAACKIEDMSSDMAALRLRSILIKCGVPKARAHEYSTHSCKDTLLAWGKQALLNKDWLEQHGKHRHAQGRGSSVARYSRDDTVGSIAVQFELINKIRNGWRPAAAQQAARGHTAARGHNDF